LNVAFVGRAPSGPGCGIGGVLLGYVVYDAFGGDETHSVDRIRWLVSIAVAAVLVVIASTVTGRNTSSSHARVQRSCTTARQLVA